ncbi:MAG TPA: pilin [Candidatus Saccharimonadales bacterium]
MKLIKLTSLIFALSLIFGIVPASANSLSDLAGAHTFASSSVAKSDACQALNQLDTTQNCSSGSQTVNNVAAEAIRVLAYIIGIASVLMIMFSGFKFITANGDPQAVSTARNTLIYAIIGLVVAVLAQFIVSHVLTSTANVQTGLLDNIKVLSRYS